MPKLQHLLFAGVPGTLLALALSGGAFADPFALLNQPNFAAPSPALQTSAYASTNGSEEQAEVAPEFRRQLVDYRTGEAPGTIIIDTPHTYLYLVLGAGKALRYGIGVGREGFTWSGTKSIERKAEWPDWTPPPEMIGRQPYLPRFVAGGPGNPLGARAMYIMGTLYRIHGTNDPSTIGQHVSSGCIRLANEDVIDLYNRVHVGTKVVVLPPNAHPAAARSPAQRASAEHTATNLSRVY